MGKARARFFISDTSGSGVLIKGKEFHHLRHVLRLAVGEEIELIDQSKRKSYLARLNSISADFAEAQIESEVEFIAVHRLHLIAGLTRSRSADLILEKCTEIGVSSFHFFSGEKSIVKPNLERMNRKVLAALKQSGAHALPHINIYPCLKDVLAALHCESPDRTEERLICLPESRRSLGALLSPQTAENTHKSSGASEPLQPQSEIVESYLVVGPEAGFNQGELGIAEGFGYQAFSLGKKTLRSETAAIVASAIVGIARERFASNEMSGM